MQNKKLIALAIASLALPAIAAEAPAAALAASTAAPVAAPASAPDSESEDALDSVVNGLAWTQAGGEILAVEVNVMEGSGKLELTGNLGTVMQESVRAALTCLRSRCGELGIDISQSPVIPGGHTSTYLFINDQQGDMQLAVSDMDIYRNLTPRVLAGRKQLLEGSQVGVIDTNLPAESIAWLADNCHAPIFADPVSTVKAEKLRPVLGKLHTLKPNRLEAELLSGVPITGTDSLHRAAQTLLETGLHRVFISLGADGVYAADQSGSVTLPAPKAEMVSTTGCGDSFMAALTWAYLQGSDLERSARAGLAASSLTMESAETIHPSMSEAELLRRMAL